MPGLPSSNSSEPQMLELRGPEYRREVCSRKICHPFIELDIEKVTDATAGLLRAIDQIRITDVMNPLARTNEISRSPNHFLLKIDQTAQHTRTAKVPGIARRIRNAAVNFHRVTPNKNEGSVTMVLGQLTQVVAVKWRFLPNDPSVF